MLVAVGLNRKVAAVEDREILALAEEDLAPALAGSAGLDGVDEVAVLSTRHRTEIYAMARFPAVAASALRAALAGRAGRELPLFELHGEAAFRHLLRVAGSVESGLLAEPRILAQLEDAFARAEASGASGPRLASLAARARAVARRIGAETGLGPSGLSLGHAAAALAGKVLGPLRGRTVLLLGAGEMARLAAQLLAAQGASVTVLDGTAGLAAPPAREVGGQPAAVDRLGAALQGADAVISALPSAPPELVPAALAVQMRRRRRPLVLVDLAVPSAIPAACGALDDVYLCDVDDLDRVMRAAQAERFADAVDAERIVEEEVRAYLAEEAERRDRPALRESSTRGAFVDREEVEPMLLSGPELAMRLGEPPRREAPGP